MKRLTQTRRLTLITMLLAMSILLHLLEPSLPIGIPGVKLGLANILGLVAMVLFSPKEMYVLNFMRVILASLLRGMIFGTGFWLAMGGTLLATLISHLLYRHSKLSLIGVSIAAAAFHGLGQILALMLINQSVFMIYWLPLLWASSVPTGLLTGFLSLEVLKRLRPL
jgi:heptaprenyl diphosphate synthase